LTNLEEANWITDERPPLTDVVLTTKARSTLSFTKNFLTAKHAKGAKVSRTCPAAGGKDAKERQRNGRLDYNPSLCVSFSVPAPPWLLSSEERKEGRRLPKPKGRQAFSYVCLFFRRLLFKVFL
jgi:hypothetical protein